MPHTRIFHSYNGSPHYGRRKPDKDQMKSQTIRRWLADLGGSQHDFGPLAPSALYVTSMQLP